MTRSNAATHTRLERCSPRALVHWPCCSSSGPLAGAVRWPWRSCLPGRSVDVPLEPASTPGRETLRHRWWDRRAGDRRHPRQRLLRYEIRTRPRVGDDRLSQIGSAVATEIADVADLGPELLGRVRSAARLAERHRMVRTRREEQRSESDEEHHGARIVGLETRACQAGERNSSVEGVAPGG